MVSELAHLVKTERVSQVQTSVHPLSLDIWHVPQSICMPYPQLGVSDKYSFQKEILASVKSFYHIPRNHCY